MEIKFFTSTNMMEFWGNVRTILSTVSPGVMISFALISLGFLLPLIVKTFSSIFKSDKKKDEENFEIRRY